MTRYYTTVDWGQDHRKQTRIRGNTLRRVMRYFVPYWKYEALVLLCIGGSTVLGLLQPLIIRGIIDTAIPQHRLGLLNLFILLMVAAALLSSLIGVLQAYWNARIGQGVMLDIRNQMYRHLLQMSMQFFTHTKTGDILSRVNNDVNNLQNVVTDTVANSVSNIVTSFSTILTMYLLDWRLATLSVMILPVFIVPTRRVGQLNFRLKKKTQEKMAELSSLMQETLSVSGALLVKVFARQDFEAGRFAKVNQALRDVQIKQSMVGRWFFMLITVISTAGPAIIYWYGGFAVMNHSITLGTVVAFTAYLTRLYGPVSSLANIHVNVLGSLALFERLFEYLDMPVDIKVPESPVHPERVIGRITFRGVSFRFSGTERNVLTQIDLDIAPGQLVALVGPSGAGKTTLSMLIPRLYDVTEGQLLIDGVDVRHIAREAIGRWVGVVTQETFLFHASIRDNLLYGNLNATTEQMIAAAKAAYIHDFIEGLPDGYDTVVGERGYKLSGGEKQRIAIARVILKNPSILILDEATSSLDSQSEAWIQAALEPLMQSRTSVVIAHRLSTVLNADRIVVMDGGRIVETGTHSELLAFGGLYARLYKQQFREDTAGKNVFDYGSYRKQYGKE
jgi:ATP-binding cassette subfamily B protein